MNNKNKIKTMLFASLIAAMILPFSGMNFAEAEEADNKRFDELGKAILLLQIQNTQLGSLGISAVDNSIAQNKATIATLQIEFDALKPVITSKEINPVIQQRMEQAMEKLLLNHEKYPTVTLGINPETGVLDIEIDSERNYEGLEKQIRKFIGNNVPVNITYGTDTTQLQAGNCAGRQGICNPIIGAAFSEEAGIGADCEITIAATKGSVDGGVTVYHCNESNNDMWQAKKGTSGHFMGDFHTDGGFWCDCSFVKSNSRSIDTSLVNWDGVNVLVTKDNELNVNDAVFLLGAHSGIDFGTIKKINQAKWNGDIGRYMTNLYEIDGINFNVGDSGAPIIKQGSNAFGGMNNMADGGFNYGHDWGHIKSSLGVN